MAEPDVAVNVTISRSDDPSYSGQFELRGAKDVIRIGRSPANNIKVTTIRGVSAYHAEIKLVDSAIRGPADPIGLLLHVRDLSMNGTGRRLPGSQDVLKLEKGIDTTLTDGSMLLVPHLVKLGPDAKTADEQRVILTVRYERPSGVVKVADSAQEDVAKTSESDGSEHGDTDQPKKALDIDASCDSEMQATPVPQREASALASQGEVADSVPQREPAVSVPERKTDERADEADVRDDSSHTKTPSKASESDDEAAKTNSESDDGAEVPLNGKQSPKEPANIEFDPESLPNIESDFLPKLPTDRSKELSTELPPLDDLLGPARSKKDDQVSDKKGSGSSPTAPVAKPVPSPKKRKRSPSSNSSRGAQRDGVRGRSRSNSRSGARPGSRSRSRSRKRRRGRRKRSRSRRGKRSRSRRSGRGRKRSRSRGKRDDEKSKASKKNGEATAQTGNAMAGMPPAWGSMPPGGQAGHHWQWGAPPGGPWAWNAAGGGMPGMQMPGMQAPWGGMQPGAGGAMNVEMCKQQIYWMYQRFRPEKLPEFESILKKYKGSEFDLLKAMCTKYFKAGTEGASPAIPASTTGTG